MSAQEAHDAHDTHLLQQHLLPVSTWSGDSKATPPANRLIALPNRASLGHARRGVRASTGAVPAAATHRRSAAASAKPQASSTTAAADADAVARRVNSRRSVACDATRPTLDSIHEAPAAAAGGSGADTAAHRDSAATDQTMHSSRGSRALLPTSKYPSRGPAGRPGAAAAAASGLGANSKAAAAAHSSQRPGSAVSGGAGSSSSLTGSVPAGSSRAVSVPRPGRASNATAAAAAPAGAAAKGRKSITPRTAQGAVAVPKGAAHRASKSATASLRPSPRNGMAAAPAQDDAAAAIAAREAPAAATADVLPEADVNSTLGAPAAVAPAAPRDSNAAPMQRSITPEAMPASAPGFHAGTFPTPGAIGVTPFGPTPVPPTAFKQGWRPGATPEATPGGLMGHFTALVTPGGPSWPHGMPAGGLVPYSITPPAGGRTMARTVLGTSRCPERPASSGGGGAAAAVDAAGTAGTISTAATRQQRRSIAAASGAQEGVGVRPYRSVTPQPAATGFASSSRSGSSSRRSVTPVLGGGGSGLGCGDVSESGSRSQTPGRTPHSAAKHAALAAQLQVRAGLGAGGALWPSA